MRASRTSRGFLPVLESWPRGLRRALLGAWFRVEIRGAKHLETPGPVVFVSPHTSRIDAALLTALLPDRVVAGPLPGPAAARRLVRAIRAGGAWALLPEGEPPASGAAAMAPMPCLARLIDRAGAQVVPIHIEGLDRSRWGRLQPGFPRRLAPKVRVMVGRPQPLGLAPDLTGRARRDLALLRLTDIVQEERRLALDRHATIPQALAYAGAAYGAGRPVLSDPRVEGLSMRALATGADALGRALSRRLGAGERVGVLLPTAASVPVVLVALWRLGVVPAMMNPTLGTGPALACLRTAQATKVLTSRAMVKEARLDPLIGTLTEAGLEILFIEDLRAEIGTREKALGALSAYLGAARHGRAFASAGKVARDNAAIVLFTSGTEGSPKGVVLSHGNLLGNVAQILARTDVDASDLMLSALPLFHSFGLTGGILVPLLGGSAVTCYPSPLHYKAIAERARLHRPTVIFGTDTFLSGWGRRADPQDFASIRVAIAGAEPVKDATRALWQDRFGVPVFEGYGATETSPVIALNTPEVARHGTAGRLLPGIEHRLEPMPGIEGQRLLVRGPNVMQGYLHAESPDRIEAPAGGWYDTGDAVTIDAEGFVSIRGRIKRFAKVGGEMVSLAAVEGLAARAWPDSAVAAVAVPDARKGNRVILAIAPHDAGTDTSPEMLQARARLEGLPRSCCRAGSSSCPASRCSARASPTTRP